MREIGSTRRVKVGSRIPNGVRRNRTEKRRNIQTSQNFQPLLKSALEHVASPGRKLPEESKPQFSYQINFPFFPIMRFHFF